MSLCSLTAPCTAFAPPLIEGSWQVFFIMGSARYLPSHSGAVPVREPVCCLCDIWLSFRRIPAIGRSVAGPDLVAVCRVAVCDAGEGFALSDVLHEENLLMQ